MSQNNTLPPANDPHVTLATLLAALRRQCSTQRRSKSHRVVFRLQNDTAASRSQFPVSLTLAKIARLFVVLLAERLSRALALFFVSLQCWSKYTDGARCAVSSSIIKYPKKAKWVCSTNEFRKDLGHYRTFVAFTLHNVGHAHRSNKNCTSNYCAHGVRGERVSLNGCSFAGVLIAFAVIQGANERVIWTPKNKRARANKTV